MRFQQVFYGRGPNDYDILGSSAGVDINAEVGRICQGIQTPRGERLDDDAQFLFQRRFGSRLIMGCGRDGPIDPFGRKTLFYHILVADAAEMQSRNLSAAEVFRAGAFVGSFCGGDVTDIDFDDGRLVSFDSSGVKCSLLFPAVVSCRRGENLKVLDLIGPRLATCSWVTMSWGVVYGFDVCGVAKSCNLSRVAEGVRVYGIDGYELNIERIHDKPEGIELPSKPSDGGAPSADTNGREVQGRGSGMLLVAGLVIGAVLGVIVGYRAAPQERLQEPQQPQSDVGTVLPQGAKVSAELEEAIDDICSAFESENSLQKFLKNDEGREYRKALKTLNGFRRKMKEH